MERLAERQLDGARLLMAGTPAVGAGLTGATGLVAVAGVGLTAAAGSPLGPTLLTAVSLLVPVVTWWAVARWYGWAAQVWATDDALVIRVRRGRWLRIPWSELRGGAWVQTSRISGPAIATTGDRDDRPNPTRYAMPCRPVLRAGWRTGERALREEFQRRGISWRYHLDDRRFSERWTTTRWDW